MIFNNILNILILEYNNFFENIDFCMKSKPPVSFKTGGLTSLPEISQSLL